MSSIKEYSKIVFQCKDGTYHTIQWKSMAVTPPAHVSEVADYLFSGDYEMVQVAMPKHMLYSSGDKS